MENTRLSVSDGMNIMKVMVDIEELRAKHDFCYKMLYAANAEAYREHYHAEIGARLLSYLGLSAAAPANEVVLCISKYTNVTAETRQDPAYAYTGPPSYEREALLTTWETFCAAVLSNTRAGVVSKVDDRKLGQDALLFMHLAYNPPFIDWLRNGDPDENADDVPVLNADQLFVFGARDVAHSVHLFNNTASIRLEDMVTHLRGHYPISVGVYNPDMGSPDEDFPDIPDDYEMGVE
jgi:hypothetical protein